MDADVFLPARIQFALTIMFHYLFPPLSIGLGALMVFMEGMYLRTRRSAVSPHDQVLDEDLRRQLRHGRRHRHRHGVPVRHQLGAATRAMSATCSARPWPRRASSPSSSNRASWPCWSSAGTASRQRMHFFATLMVALGSHLLGHLDRRRQLLAAHAGRLHEIDGQTQAVITDFWAMVFNPSSMNRLVHACSAPSSSARSSS